MHVYNITFLLVNELFVILLTILSYLHLVNPLGEVIEETNVFVDIDVMSVLGVVVKRNSGCSTYC